MGLQIANNMAPDGDPGDVRMDIHSSTMPLPQKHVATALEVGK